MKLVSRKANRYIFSDLYFAIYTDNNIPYVLYWKRY